MMMMQQLYVGSGPFITRTSSIMGVRQLGCYTARLLEFSITGRLPSKLGGAAYRRLRRHLLRSLFPKVSTTTTERYVLRDPVWLFIMFCEYMLSCCLFPIILLFSTSHMFELHELVACFVMIYILELIVEIMPNIPTIQKPYCRQVPELTMAGFTNALRPYMFTGVH